MADWKCTGQSLDNGLFGRTADWMKPAARCIMNHIVVAGRTDTGRNVIQSQCFAHFPGNNVVGAGSVTADAQGSDQFMVFIIQGEAAPKYVHTTDFSANHWVVCLAVLL